MSDLVPLDKHLRDTEYVRKQSEVYDEWIMSQQRSIDYTKIAKKHNLTRAQVISMIDDVHAYFRQSGVAKDIAQERLAQANRSWDMLTSVIWEAIEEMKANPKMADKIASSAKAISDIEAKRVEMLQKTGLLEDYEMGNMVAEAEEKVAAVSELLKKVAEKHPETKQMIVDGLRRIQNPDILPEPDIIEGKAK